MTRIKNHIWLLSGLLGAFLLAGCIMVGTFVIDYEFASDENFDGLMSFDIDLTEEEDWEEHKDKIKDIDNVGFVLQVANNDDEDVDVEMYIDAVGEPIYYELEDIQANMDIILDNVTFAASGVTTIDWPTSLTKVKNVAILKDYAESGVFRIYLVSDQTSVDVTIEFGVVAVTVTAGE